MQDEIKIITETEDNLVRNSKNVIVVWHLAEAWKSF